MKEKVIFIFGSTGQLGQELGRVLAARPGWKVRPWSHPDLDVTDAARLRDALEEGRPWAAVNCTACNQVEAAQENAATAFAVNAAAVASLAGICRRLGVYLVHFSTDYVFDGESDRPYREEDPVNPLNIYGLSKWAGEQAVRLLRPRHCVIRTCGLYGLRRGPNSKRNFVEAILAKARRGERIEVRRDLMLAPTYAPELAEATARLMERGAEGIFHVANAGQCSWHEFAREILKQAGLPDEVAALDGPPAPDATPRPRRVVFDTSKLARAGVDGLSPWREALARYFAERGKDPAHGIR